MTQDIQTEVKNLVSELLKHLEIEAQIKTEEQDGAILVQLETEAAGILIGHYGRNLEAIQILVGQMFYKKLGNWTRVIISVGDYRERRKKQLEDLSKQTADKVAETGEPVILSQLSPGERRVVHMHLTDHPQVITESEGIGRDRKLIVKLKI